MGYAFLITNLHQKASPTGKKTSKLKYASFFNKKDRNMGGGLDTFSIQITTPSEGQNGSTA